MAWRSPEIESRSSTKSSKGWGSLRENPLPLLVARPTPGISLGGGPAVIATMDPSISHLSTSCPVSCLPAREDGKMGTSQTTGHTLVRPPIPRPYKSPSPPNLTFSFFPLFSLTHTYTFVITHLTSSHLHSLIIPNRALRVST